MRYLYGLAVFLGWPLTVFIALTLVEPVQPKATPQVTRSYPSYCYDRSRDFYLPCMYSSKEYRA